MTGRIYSHKGAAEPTRYVYLHFGAPGVAFRATPSRYDTTVVGPKQEAASAFDGHNILEAGVGVTYDSGRYFSVDEEKKGDVVSLCFPYGVVRSWYSTALSEEGDLVWVTAAVNEYGSRIRDVIHYEGKKVDIPPFVLSAALVHHPVLGRCLFYVRATVSIAIWETQHESAPMFPLNAGVIPLGKGLTGYTFSVSAKDAGINYGLQGLQIGPYAGSHSQDGQTFYTSVVGTRSNPDDHKPWVTNLTISYLGAVVSSQALSGPGGEWSIKTQSVANGEGGSCTFDGSAATSITQTSTNMYRGGTLDGPFSFGATENSHHNGVGHADIVKESTYDHLLHTEEHTWSSSASYSVTLTVWDGLTIPLDQGTYSASGVYSYFYERVYIRNENGAYIGDTEDVHWGGHLSHTGSRITRTLRARNDTAKILIFQVRSSTGSGTQAGAGTTWSQRTDTVTEVSKVTEWFEVWYGNTVTKVQERVVTDLNTTVSPSLEDVGSPDYVYGARADKLFLGAMYTPSLLSLWPYPDNPHEKEASSSFLTNVGRVALYTIGVRNTWSYHTHLVGLGEGAVVCIPVIPGTGLITPDNHMGLDGITGYSTLFFPSEAMQATQSELSSPLSVDSRVYSVHPVT